MPTHSLPRVLVFPADDVALCRQVDAALAATDAGFPDDPTPVWYVYRDGRIRHRNPGLERLYAAIGDARETIRLSESAIESARSMLKIAGVDVPDEYPGAFAPVEALRRTARP